MKSNQERIFINKLIKTTFFQFIISLVFIGITYSQAYETTSYAELVKHPVYPPDTNDISKMKQSVELMMRLSLEEVIAEVPVASGINFVGCPNCNGGAQENGVLGWKHGMGDKVFCNYCNMVFPNEK